MISSHIFFTKNVPLEVHMHVSKCLEMEALYSSKWMHAYININVDPVSGLCHCVTADYNADIQAKTLYNDLCWY